MAIMNNPKHALEIGLAAAAIAGLAWGAYEYASKWPTSQLFGRTLIAPRKPQEVALTYDDGPNPRCTPPLLEVLAKHNVRATFFVIGQYAAAERTLLREIAAAGHLIANHTWTHPDLARTSARETREQLTRTSSELGSILGTPIRFFRPPFGGRRPITLRIARELGMVPVTWNIIGNDWSAPSSEAIVTRVENLMTRNGHRGFATNLCLHDGSHREPQADRSRTVAATDELIQRHISSKKFVTLDAWNSE